METPSDTVVAAPAPPRHLAIGTLLATGGQIAPLVAAAGVSLTIARLYGPSATGVMSLVMNLFDVALMVFTLGLSSGITYLVSRREWTLTQVLTETSLAAVGLGLLGGLCGVVFFLLARHSVFHNVPLSLALIPLASMPFALSWAFSAATALGGDSYEAYAGFEVLNSAVLLIAGVSLAIAVGLTGAVASFAAANVVTAVLAVGWLRRKARAVRCADGTPASDAPPQLKRATRFGLYAWSANLLQLLNYRLDIFILSAVAGHAAIGVYSIAVSITAVGWVLPNAFQTVLFPRVASLDAAAGAGHVTSAESDSGAARAIRHATLLVIPTAVALVAAVVLIPVVYGGRFDRSVLLGFVLIPGVAALGVAKVASAVFTGRGFPRYALYSTTITLPITVALYATLIPQLHALGAAVASTISYVIAMVVSIVFVRRATALPLRAMLVPRHSDLLDYRAALRLGTKRLQRMRPRRR